MDFHALQNKLFELDPTDPRDDLAKLQEAAKNGGSLDVQPTKDYVNETAQVRPGTLDVGTDSLTDFAALAGIRIDETQKTGPAGQAKGKDPMPKAEPGRTKHPLRDKLVGEADDDLPDVSTGIASLQKDVGSEEGIGLVSQALQRAVQGQTLGEAHKEALAPYVNLITTILSNPSLRTKLASMAKLVAKEKPEEEPEPEDTKDKTESIKMSLFKQLQSMQEAQGKK